MQDSAAGIFALQLILQLQRFKRIIGITDRNLRGVGVINVLARSCLKDVRKTLFIFFGKTVSGALGGSGLQIIEI